MICKENLFAIKNPCKTINNLRICNNNNLIDIANDKCIPNLLKGKKSHCTVTNGFHIPKVESVIPGLLMLNEFNDSLEINGEQLNLRGTYIIRYQNTSIKVGNQEYSLTETIQYKPLPAIIRAPSTMSYEKTLTLQSLEQLHLNNTSIIKLLERKQIRGFAISLISIALIIFIIIATIIYKYLKSIKSAKTDKSLPSQPTVQIIDKNPSFVITNADVRN